MQPGGCYAACFQTLVHPSSLHAGSFAWSVLLLAACIDCWHPFSIPSILVCSRAYLPNLSCLDVPSPLGSLLVRSFLLGVPLSSCNPNGSLQTLASLTHLLCGLSRYILCHVLKPICCIQGLFCHKIHSVPIHQPSHCKCYWVVQAMSTARQRGISLQQTGSLAHLSVDQSPPAPCLVLGPDGQTLALATEANYQPGQQEEAPCSAVSSKPTMYTAYLMEEGNGLTPMEFIALAAGRSLMPSHRLSSIA